jgi:hypothetical protein
MENINHPRHYNLGKYEVIDVIEDWKLGFNLGNAVKYIARAGHKHRTKLKEDLEKALWYVNREIRLHETAEVQNELFPSVAPSTIEGNV